MSKEIERRFYTFDRKILEEKIKEFGGVKKGMYLFQILVFIPPKSYSMLRLRDEGYRITFTLKKRGSDGYEIEDEVIVSNFKEMRTILEKMGNKKKYFIQKIREIYDIGESELVFDHYPGLPSLIEIESPTEEELFSLADKLNLIKDEPHKDAGDLYLECYGVTKNKPLLDLTFDNIYKIFKKYITKNKDVMLQILEGQIKLLDKINHN